MEFDKSKFRKVPIPEYKDHYIIDNVGNVYSLYNNKQKLRSEPYLRKSILQSTGYYSVLLARTLNGKKINTCRSVHRLACEAFHGPAPSGKHQVAHLNGIPTDNRIENLAWVTKKENERHKADHGTKLTRDRNHQSKMNSRMVTAAVYLKKKHGFSDAEVARVFGVAYQTISKALKTTRVTE